VSWCKYKLKQEKYPELTYSAYLQIEELSKRRVSPLKAKPSYNQYKGHDHKKEWESLYSQVEDNGYLRDDNIYFDLETRYRVPGWAYRSALMWRPK
tara:strand:- start:679 stop:966 length:288 start_codon:yes stop_codon:yes gene_type:complete